MVGPCVQLVGPDHGLQIGGVKLLGPTTRIWA
jgi:hypothetical protein